MIAEKNISNPSHIAKYTYFSFGLIMSLWVIAWIFKIQIDTVIHEIELGSFIYWTTAKFLIWILPSLWLIRLSGRTLNQVFNVSNYKTWLLWGLGLGSCIAVAGFAQNYMAGIPIVPTRVDYGRINALLISPIFEEFLVRGALMGNLQKTYPFLKSNLVSSFMFVALHIPGWFFFWAA